VTFLWDEKGVILVKFLLRRTTVSSHRNTWTSWSLNACLRQVHPTTNISEVLLFHDSIRPYIKRAVYLPCSPDLIPSRFCPTDPWKDSLWGHHDRVRQNTVHQWPNGMEKVKEDSWRRCRLHSEIAMPSAMLYVVLWSFHMSNEISNRRHCLHAREL
jgi:hypothetical protein